MKRSCQKCHERAIIHITEIRDDQYEELHLCQRCADAYLQEGEEALLEKSDAHLLSTPDPVFAKLKCERCGATFADFRNTGRLGCPTCYYTFRNELRPLLENIHGEVRHIGKVPRRLPPDAQLQARLVQLRQELQHTIAIEDYERAAQLRDEIDSLDKRQQT